MMRRSLLARRTHVRTHGEKREKGKEENIEVDERTMQGKENENKIEMTH